MPGKTRVTNRLLAFGACCIFHAPIYRRWVHYHQLISGLALEVGIEPTTRRFRDVRSTTELLEE